MPELWGEDSQGNKVYYHQLHNAQGMKVCVTNYGAIIKDIIFPSKQYGAVNTVLNYPRLEQYFSDKHFIGAVCGRFCNRIAGASFTLNDQTFQLDDNEGGNHLHGGSDGFSQRTWSVEEATSSSIRLSLVSKDGDQGYPGRLIVTVTYTLHDDNRLVFSWAAQSDADTVISLTNHSYFNLAGFGDIKHHRLTIPAGFYTPTSENGIPTGEISSVANSPLDFQQARALDPLLSELPPELEAFGGLDHNWTHNSDTAKQLTTMAQLQCPESAIALEVQSTLPGIQCYTGNHLATSGVFGSFEGICLETQFYPNSPNMPHFPSPLLRAGELLRHDTHYLFSEL